MKPTPEKDPEKGRFLTGNIGGPGRPRGARNILGEAFLQDMLQAWQTQGMDVIARVIADKPEQFLRVIAMILPKELHIKAEPLSEMTDDELVGILSTLRSQAARLSSVEDRSGTGTKAVN